MMEIVLDRKNVVCLLVDRSVLLLFRETLVLSFLSAQPRCPDPAGKIGVCAELCYSDSDCPYGQKCCFNGCGHQCMATTQGEILDKETNYTAASPKSVFVLQ
ncbi:hypothetical protein ATANTOWER_015154 [Ataeniobius toweri]|uniref:WAP domain-containing protein n=1 Tax=Ataeniobius toweri TaxID=208326 RepID=A0ABU7ARN1_9TELE|nr:hypothetical protein [Ataeniobius toweri]